MIGVRMCVVDRGKPPSVSVEKPADLSSGVFVVSAVDQADILFVQLDQSDFRRTLDVIASLGNLYQFIQRLFLRYRLAFSGFLQVWIGIRLSDVSPFLLMYHIAEESTIDTDKAGEIQMTESCRKNSACRMPFARDKFPCAFGSLFHVFEETSRSFNRLLV